MMASSVGRRRLAALLERQFNSVGGVYSHAGGEAWTCLNALDGSWCRAEVVLMASASDGRSSISRGKTTSARPQPPFGGVEWAVRRVEEKRVTTKYMTTSDYMRLWSDANLSRENGERLAKELLHRGVVMKLGNTVFLEGENVVRAVDEGIPDCPLEVKRKLESLESELEPLEKLKKELDQVAFTRSKRLLVGGLGGMILQFVVFSRLTFWDSSWDVIEPITYFTTLGLTMGAYLYFLKTKQKFRYHNVYNTVGDMTAQKLYEKHKLDYKKYRKLKGEVERWRRYSSVK
ncbi:hypothetical protein BSKO_07398 [Bryopsis sp. KO-2023]|nr:hypothetical protein BSKO_07398 [Bryopsis sp. KO-2023]